METLDQKTERNCRVQARYDELMREGKHGHYETVFRVVREEVEAEREQQAAQIKALRADAERLRSAMQEALNCIPAVSFDGSFFVEHSGPDGEYLGTEQIAPVNVVQHMAAVIDAALRQEQPKEEGA